MSKDTTQIAAGTIGGISAAIATHPLEVIRVRRQVLHDPHFSLSNLIRSHGFKALYRGLLPAMLYQSVMNSTRFLIYPKLKYQFSSPTANLISTVAAGASAGAIAAGIATPFNLWKTRMQAGGQFAQVFAPTGSIWRRLFPNMHVAMLRTALSSTCQLAAFDYIKLYMSGLPVFSSNNSNSTGSVIALQASSAAVSGTLATVLMNPVDVALTRLFNQKTGPSRQFHGLAHCLWSAVQQDGFWSLWRGLLPNLTRIGPYSVVLLVVSDQCRLYLT